jgi:signal transduction histidine kinase
MARRLLKAEDKASLLKHAATGMKLLFSLNDVYFFFHDAKRDALVGQPIKDNARSTALTRLHIPMKMKHSLPVSALLKNTITDSITLPQGSELSLMENQLLHFLGTRGMLCLPLATDQKALGIILAGVDREHYDHLKYHKRLLQIISREVSTALLSHHNRQKHLEKKHTAAMQAQKQLTRKTVHEVNNPLGAIKNYLRVLELKLSRDGIVLDEVRIIADEINRVIRIINTLTGSENPDHVTRTPADLNAIMLDTASLFKDTLQQRGIEVQLDLDGSVPPTVLNKDHLKQIFMNLVKNAMEAMQDSGTIHLKTSYAKVSSPADSGTVPSDVKGHISILVADDGPGIPDKLKNTIFDPQVTAKKGHQGLGLTIVRDLVGRMEGSIDLTSNQDQGTCFTIKLPVVQS